MSKGKARKIAEQMQEDKKRVARERAVRQRREQEQQGRDR